MNKHLKHAWVPAAATSMLFMSACEEEKESEMLDSNALLVGEWQLKSFNGESYVAVYEDYAYRVIFDFKSDGNFNWCDDYESYVNASDSYKDCYDGSWEWTEVGKELSFSFLPDEDDGYTNSVYEVDLVIDKLTETELEGTWKSEDDTNGPYEVNVVLEKVN